MDDDLPQGKPPATYMASPMADIVCDVEEICALQCASLLRMAKVRELHPQECQGLLACMRALQIAQAAFAKSCAR